MRSRYSSTAVPSRRYLAKIPGRYIVAAMDLLPPCGPDAPNQRLTVDAPFLGKFHVTFRPRSQSLQGWGVRWFWIPTSAEPSGERISRFDADDTAAG